MKTRAELSDYQETSRYADVMAFFGQLQKRSPLVRLQTFGRAYEGRDLPLVVISEPPISSPQEARRSGKATVLVLGNIHAGEVEGKEASQEIARRLAGGDLRNLLKKVIVLLAPIYNADANERISLTNRTDQNGPIRGVGLRENAQGLDLNRDFMKIEAPETMALIGLFNEWDPHLTVDLHTTDGSFHGYHLTYSTPLNPSADEALLDYHRGKMMPALTRGGNRSGWDFFQRDQSVGWQFRMFNGAGGARVFDPQGGPYTVGQWHHLVAVHDASVPSATLYLNGVSVAADNTPDGTFAPKTFGDLAIGSFSQPWMNPQGYENAFEGSIGQVAIYTNALSLSRIQAHYNNATNPSPATPYSAVVLSDGPVGYWRLNEGPHNLSTNLGSLATAADGVYVNTANGVAGPQAPAYAGFAADNKAKTFNGSSSYVELHNPSGLNFTGQITVEAWVQPSASLNAFANVLAHGVNRGDNAELVLRLTDANSYLFAAWDGANHGSGTAVPAGDLGSTNWVYLAGTYDGANWNLYRNGALAATVADGTGAVLVNDAAWAIGARGRWAQAYGYDAGALFPNRQFTGGIDEPAIYSTALTRAQIQAHWLVGKYGTTTPPVPTLTIVRSGGDVVLTWSVGVLLEATDMNGPYAEVSGATSAFLVPATAAQKYYRVRL